MEGPEPIERGRNFRLLADEELPKLLEFLTEHLPESLKFQQTVLTYMRNKVWDFYFYVADGWPSVPICLHFPGMTQSPNRLLYESFGVFCPTDSLDHLQHLRDEDILIDWAKPLYINFVHSEIAAELFRLYNDTGKIEKVLGDVWGCEELDKTIKYEDDGDDEDDDNVIEGKVLPLCAEHAESIHELYPANDMECHELFLRLIKLLPAAGVFVDGKLAAWMIQSYYGAMFSMQTKPEYRRKGYGTRLARYLTKVVVDRGYTPFVVIRPENEASQSLYKKLGFRKFYQTVRATFTPDGWNEIEIDNNDTLLLDSFVDAVRNIKVEQRVMQVFKDDGEDNNDLPNYDDNLIGEIEKNCFIRDIECLETMKNDTEENGGDEFTCGNVDGISDVPDSGGDDDDDDDDKST